ncbi:MAG TPA: NAD(P)-binding protein [Candidatus Acidoferrum sp.]|nr:NAD(P)-binding protein [Candidatus Acidoferrum sp.]
MTGIDTDYLVIGAGAAGMAFADSLITESDADVVMVDRRHASGGHWNDAYPFVRLHQPSAFYGVNSRVLGNDSIDTVGPNAGFYERATAAEICDYFRRVLEERLLASGRVRFFSMSDYRVDPAGDHQFVSRLTGAVSKVHVRRKIVDATYLEAEVPSTHVPPFGVDANARLIPINDLVTVLEPGSAYTVIGAGKTGMDACMWLLENGVAPGEIRWIRPRDAWLLNRAFQQPLELVGSIIEGMSLAVEATAQAENVKDLFRRLEACEVLLRLGATAEPAMFRCATVSAHELQSLRTIENVVRQGRVVHVGTDRIVLQDGSIPTDGTQVHIDCSAAGLRVAPPRPIFEPGRITLQQVRTCQPTFNAALIAHVEACRDDDTEKNRLCPPNPYPSSALDWISATYISQRAEARWLREPDLAAWMERSRLNGSRGISEHMSDPQVQSAFGRLLANSKPAIDNLKGFLALAP